MRALAASIVLLLAACGPSVEMQPDGGGAGGGIDGATAPPDATALPDVLPPPDAARVCDGDPMLPDPPSCAALGVVIDPFYAERYSCFELGPVPGVPPSKHGGLTLTPESCQTTLLIGGDANYPEGKLYAIQVARDAAGHIGKFVGTATVHAEAPYNDGGVVFGPGDVLFLARWPRNEMGQIRPGSTVTDKVIDLGPLGVASSPGGLGFVPPGFGGAGQLKLVSWPGGATAASGQGGPASGWTGTLGPPGPDGSQPAPAAPASGTPANTSPARRRLTARWSRGADGADGLQSRAMDVRTTIVAAIESRAAELAELARRIHANPELRFEERRAAEWIGALVEAAGVAVERGLAGMPTAFRARAGRGGGPRVAILAEYDALPEIGHACGHNLIAGGAVGAFLGLAAAASALGGEVVLVGTPAEEGGGGKIKLLEAGAFEGLDAAIMYHPFDRDLLAHPALASEWLTFRFTGRPSHAAAAPWEGNSALSAVIQTFNLIDSQRVHFRDGARVHGFITDGGQAVNIIPERAACQFSVRAPTHAYLERLVPIVVDCARAAALATRVDLQVERRRGYKDMRNNMTLARRFGRHLAARGRIAAEDDASVGAGSTDMGDVSHVVPSIHPYVAICDAGEAMCHQHAFVERAASDRAMRAMLDAAAAMALTAADVLADGDLRAEARRELEAARGSRLAERGDGPNLTCVTRDLEPKGEALRRAVRWIGERRRDDPKLPLARLVDEAARRFDLSPLDQDFLLRELAAKAP